MMRARTHTAMATFAVAAALALGACGSDDDGDAGDAGGAGGGAAPAAGAETPQPAGTDLSAKEPSQTGNEQPQVEESFRAMRRAFDLGNAAGVCERLTIGGKAEVANYQFRMRKEMTCEQVMAEIIARNRRGDVEQRPFDVAGVDIDGYKAVISVKTVGRPVTKTRLMRVDGQWKIVSLGLNRPPTLNSAPQPRS